MTVYLKTHQRQNYQLDRYWVSSEEPDGKAFFDPISEIPRSSIFVEQNEYGDFFKTYELGLFPMHPVKIVYKDGTIESKELPAEIPDHIIEDLWRSSEDSNKIASIEVWSPTRSRQKGEFLSQYPEMDRSIKTQLLRLDYSRVGLSRSQEQQLINEFLLQEYGITLEMFLKQVQDIAM